MFHAALESLPTSPLSLIQLLTEWLGLPQRQRAGSLACWLEISQGFFCSKQSGWRKSWTQVLREKSTETLACPLQVFPEDFSVCEFECSRSRSDESNSAPVRLVVRLFQEGSRQSGVWSAAVKEIGALTHRWRNGRPRRAVRVVRCVKCVLVLVLVL